ncbi:hypothetical protein MRB53_040677 [Persea americana]|nr:hypothetical protein MRB53_040677 [Persea americana]
MVPKSLATPTKERPVSEMLRHSELQSLNNAILHSLHSTTLLLIGALLQGLVVLMFPRIWALLPTTFVLLARFADSIAITLRFKPNPYLEDSIFEKWSVAIPDNDGTVSSEPADEKVAVLLLGLKVNHPLGLFAPNVKRIDEFAREMAKELDMGAPDNGFLNQISYQTRDAKGAPEALLLSYWRSTEDIHTYANGPLHKQAVVWWEKKVKENPEAMKYIGISHETFEAPRGSASASARFWIRGEAPRLDFAPLFEATGYRNGSRDIYGHTPFATIENFLAKRYNDIVEKPSIAKTFSSNRKAVTLH